MLDQALPLDVFFALSVEKYYKNRENSIGSAGDFITSPEASQMFCHAVGLWVYNQISYVKENISLVELGPGHGTLMNEVLNLLKTQIIINNVYFVETSPLMIAKQKHAVSSHIETNFHGVNSIDKIPSDIKHIVIANEFFDALPIKQFIACHDGFKEIYVSKDWQLVLGLNIISNEEMSKIMQYSKVKVEDFKQNEIFELSTASLSILDKICQDSHAALIIDYGYDKPERKNTIKSIKNHTILDDCIVVPGSADISAEVDFGAMQGLIDRNYPIFHINYLSQKNFLINNHIEIIAEKARNYAKNQLELDLVQSELYKILIEIGERFKTLSISRYHI